MSDTFGPTSPTPFAHYDRGSSCWRTWQVISLWGSETFSETWPRSGSMRNGACYEQPTLASATTAPDSSSLLLPTPTAYESQPTEEYVEEMREAGVRPDKRLHLPGRKWHTQRTLSRIVPALLPTPAAADGERGPDYARATRDGSGGDDLVTTMHRLLSTPTAGDAKSTGASTAPPSNDTPPLWDEPRLPLFADEPSTPGSSSG